MKGQEFVLTSPPRGVFEEGFSVAATGPFPGVCMEIVAAVAPIGGRFEWQVRQSSAVNGAKGPVICLGPDRDQGGLMTTQYQNWSSGGGIRLFMYWPVAGEELNMRLRETVGTGTHGSENIGDLLAIENGTGELVANSSYTSAPFMLLEHLGVASTDQPVWVKYLGNQA